ncbi:hypothetical protein CFP56_037340 [Quercus suber]|uniref:Uncharacterized protein n=1 Tax=Quercus suber TaxID=58331 RepID=A0AAW0J4T1_QUESU
MEHQKIFHEHPLVFNEDDERIYGEISRYWVVATVVSNANGSTFINYVLKYLLNCAIPRTQNMPLFFLMNGYIATTMNIANAKFAKNFVRDTLMAALVATLTFTTDVLLYHLPWNLKSITTH